MRRPLVGLLGLTLVCGTVTAVGTSASAIAPTKTRGPSAVKQGPHDLPNPLGDKQRALRSEAVQQVLAGTAKAAAARRQHRRRRWARRPTRHRPTRGRAGSRAATAAARSTSSSSRETTDKVFVILVEFGDERQPELPRLASRSTPSASTGRCTTRSRSPPSTDNSTVWQPDYSKAYFTKTYFGTGRNVESLKTYYEKQSSGRYSVDGHRERLGQGAVQPGALRPQRLRRHRVQQRLGPRARRVQRVGRRPEGSRVAATPRSPPTSRPTTSGTATTSTVTATSTSPTATSTTSS